MSPRLIGQRTAETLLARAIARNSVGHAYLFLGPSSCGKSTAASLFARAMNCERQPAVRKDEGGRMKDEGGRMKAELAGDAELRPSSFILHPLRLAPCGECESCRRIAAGTHPEVIEVRPGSKGGQNISVEQARDIRRNAALRPKVGHRRTYLIPQAQTFSEEAANALLKTLEEPPPFVTLILCAPNPSLVLPTIRSRCRIVRFGLAGPGELTGALAAEGTPEETARALARASGGRVGTALALAGDPAALDRRRRILDLFFRALAAAGEARKYPGAAVVSLRLAEQFRRLPGKDAQEDDAPARPAKTHLIEGLDVGLSLLRDLMLLTAGADPCLAQNQDCVDALAALAADREAERVLEDLRSVREAQQLLDRNVAAQIVLERMFWALISGPWPAPAPLFEEVRV